MPFSPLGLQRTELVLGDTEALQKILTPKIIKKSYSITQVFGNKFICSCFGKKCSGINSRRKKDLQLTL